MQVSKELQQQIDVLQEEATQKAAASSSQAGIAAADMAALQQELNELTQRLKAAESGQAEFKDGQEQWKGKCSKFQQVQHSASGHCLCLTRIAPHDLPSWHWRCSLMTQKNPSG